MAAKTEVPTFDKLINPTLKALHKLGGSGSISEIVSEIINDLKIQEDVADIPHGRGSQTELEYRSAWARNYLKNYGLVENSDRAVWSLSAEGLKTQSVDSRQLVKTVQHKQKAQKLTRQDNDVEAEEVIERLDWRESLLDLLMSVPPEAFERLCQRILRESGFIEVEVTGKTGDGGIDGHGTMRLGGLISFNVLFQSKRRKGNIGPEVVRDFRGAMIGRADKGVIITTGGFTRDAKKEATRDGAPPVDLIDGELLVEKLKELRLGVVVKMVESIEIQESWFKGL
jgi:restriction system protein